MKVPNGKRYPSSSLLKIAIQRSHMLLSATAQLFDALDARSNFERHPAGVGQPAARWSHCRRKTGPDHFLKFR
jgi:hypothetical protein